jgi:hypothetical protein
VAVGGLLLGALLIGFLTVWAALEPDAPAPPSEETGRAGATAAPATSDADASAAAEETEPLPTATESSATDAGAASEDGGALDAGVRPKGTTGRPGRLPDIYNDTYVPSRKKKTTKGP